MGMRFAQMELKLVLAKLLHRYQLKISSQVFLKFTTVEKLIFYFIIYFLFQSKPFETVIGTTTLSPRNGVFIQLTDTHS